PPPPVAAPPPPPRPACNTGPYIVFFDFDNSDISPEASTILNNAVTAYANCGMARVMLAGHTDTSGSAQYNMGLAQRRNDAVRSYMTGRGVPSGQITGEAFGETQPRVPTADGVREAQNRRVEVTYGPGSGM
ncbi:MAG: OmpA family protein, partial [Erythrobacter sp.]|nr:OmpA family protein [Erythrobacter sp.]